MIGQSRDEGTSHHYLEPSVFSYASAELTERAKRSLDKIQTPYTVGTSWTVDAPFRETVAEVRKYQEEGILTVEMEAAALFAVAEYRNVQLGAILTVSDTLADLTWNPQFHHPQNAGWSRNSISCRRRCAHINGARTAFADYGASHNDPLADDACSAD